MSLLDAFQSLNPLILSLFSLASKTRFEKAWILAFAGVASHLCLFRWGEWHRYTPFLFCFYIFLVIIVFFVDISYVSASIVQSAEVTLLVTTSYCLGLFGSIAVYRIFFHRLRGFPGPFFAKVSKLWHVYQGWNGKNHIFLEKMRQKYGKVVRTGPSELTIFSAEALSALHRSNPAMSRSAWYDVFYPNISVGTVRDYALHDRQRRLWERGLNMKAMTHYETQFNTYLDLLETRIADTEAKNGSLEMNAWFSRLALDFVGFFSFSQSFDMLRTGTYHEAVIKLRNAMEAVSGLIPVPWFIQLGFRLVTFIKPTRDWNNFAEFCRGQISERIEMSSSYSCVFDAMINASKEKGFFDSEKKWIEGEAISLIVAGGDTVAASLIFLFYELAKHPQETTRLNSELQEIDIHDDYKLRSLPFLNACIQESQRLHPVLPSHTLRDTPQDGMMIGEHFIPGDVTVVSPRYSIGRLEVCFQNANEFIPDRWHNKPEMVKDKRAHNPFADGRASCLGKSMALWEIRTVVARLVAKYHVNFADGEDGSRVEGDEIDTFNLVPGELELSFKLRD